MAAVPELGRAVGLEPQVAPEAVATHQLYERYARQIYGFCYRQLGNREEAEDAVQTTFMNAFRGLSRGTSPEAEAAWLYKIAHNVCLTRRGAAGRRGRIEAPGDIQALQEFVAAPQRRGTDELIELQEALAAMPSNQRKAILLREWRGLSYHEIAEELGLSQGAVETLIFRARRSLAKGLEASPEEHRKVWRRLRQGMDVGSLLGILKTLMSGGAAAKAVATAAAVTTTAVVTTVPGDERIPRRAQLQRLASALQVAEAKVEPSLPAALTAAPAVAERRSAPVVAARTKAQAKPAAPAAEKRRAPKVTSVAAIPPPVVEGAQSSPASEPVPADTPEPKAGRPDAKGKPEARRKPAVALERPTKRGERREKPQPAPAEQSRGQGDGNAHGHGDAGGPPAEPGKGNGQDKDESKSPKG